MRATSNKILLAFFIGIASLHAQTARDATDILFDVNGYFAPE